MSNDATSRYATLRTTRTMLRWVSPVVGSVIALTGFGLFVERASRLVSSGFSGGFTMTHRAVIGLEALVYLVGIPLAGEVVRRSLRAAGDWIDLAMDAEVSAEKTADLVERQVVPTLHRACQSLERIEQALLKRQARPAPLAEPARRDSLAPSPGSKAMFDAAQRAVASGTWADARRQVDAFMDRFPDDPRAATLHQSLDLRRQRDVPRTRELLKQAQQASNAEQVLDLRDRLCEYLEGQDQTDLDRQVGRWAVLFLREALAGGRAADVIDIAERVAETFGDSSSEGAHLRTALPMLRRGAGRCPECGQPYDVTLVRCAACTTKREQRRASAAPAAPPEPARGSGAPTPDKK
jgi:hypothetical protein